MLKIIKKYSTGRAIGQPDCETIYEFTTTGMVIFGLVWVPVLGYLIKLTWQ